MAIKEDDVLFLLGAGCSADATIPTSTEMLSRVEADVLDTQDYNYTSLYHLVKSAIMFGRGIAGHYGDSPNIEQLMEALTELGRKETNLLFPFVGSWNGRLTELAGHEFKHIRNLASIIRLKLTSWVILENYMADAGYYESFYSFQKCTQVPLRVFTLNYDLCFENARPHDFDLELGFQPDTRAWEESRFEARDTQGTAIWLYKLHGSIDWKREPTGRLKRRDEYTPECELIFGTSSKLQALDPYLFYVYELRKYSLRSKLIVTVGYGYGDLHINDLLKQALQSDSDKRLLAVTRTSEPEEVESNYKALLGLTPDCEQIRVVGMSAKDFLREALSPQNIEAWMAKPDSSPF